MQTPMQEMKTRHQLGDAESQVFLDKMAESEQAKTQKVAGVRSVVVVLSAAAMVFDMEALRQKILLSYPDAAVFFLTTLGKPVGPMPPEQVDLLIDFTGPGQRQPLLFARRLRRMARFAVGRNVGFFRRKIYDRVLGDDPGLPTEILDREREVQREVLRLAGVAFVPAGDVLADRGKTIAVELPPYAKL